MAKKPARATLMSDRSGDRRDERNTATPKTVGEIVGKAADEAKGQHGVVEKVKAVGRELDRNVGGEYERREDEGSNGKPSSAS